MQIPDVLLFWYPSLEIANDYIFLMLEKLRHHIRKTSETRKHKSFRFSLEKVRSRQTWEISV